MNPFLITTLISLLACCFILTLVWLWAVKINNAGIVDVFWSYNFPVIAIICYFVGEGSVERKMLLCGMIILWGLRLGTYLLVRVFGHLDREDVRYAKLRVDWAPNANAKFFGFFMMQAVSNVILALPFIIVCQNTAPKISVIEYAGMVLWGGAVLGEAIADRQMQVFKKDPANKGKICNIGLWNYSRHPNYFFEWLIWVAYFIFALVSPYGWIGIVSPLIILYLLLKVTGIPMTEELMLRSRGEAFKEYQRTTSSFVPWFKKK